LVFQFNQITLDTVQYRLCLSGKLVSVEPQVFDLLVYLVENRERVVSRDELLENLWKGKVVTDAALGVRLKDVRKAVGDSGAKQSVIKTVHGRGYQFIADVSESNGNDTTPSKFTESSHETLLRTDKPSIAVLPFHNLSNDPEQDYFSEGITEDIIANLCRYRELFVIDHHSTFTYGNDCLDTALIANELGVEYVAKGNIRRLGEQIRVSTQLIEAKTGKAVWAERIDRKLDDIFALEDEVTARIATSLVSHIEDEIRERATLKHPENMTAFDCVMRARRQSQSYDRDQNAWARGLLEHAIELDPEYAAAYAHLARSYCVEADTEWCKSREEALEQALIYAQKAVELDEFDFDTHSAMGKTCLALNKFDLAEAHLDRAIECNPNAYGAFCAKSWVLALSGRASEVQVCGTTALNLNPLAPDECLLSMIVGNYSERKYDTALEMLSRVRQPDANSEAWRAACLAQAGHDDEAQKAAEKVIEMGGDFIRHEDWLRIWTFKDSADLEHFIEGLYKAGVLLKPSGK
jgi:TolB-like protein/Tfp pilus assembly protein PilF